METALTSICDCAIFEVNVECKFLWYWAGKTCHSKTLPGMNEL